MDYYENSPYQREFYGDNKAHCFAQAQAKGWLVTKKKQLCPGCTGD